MRVTVEGSCAKRCPYRDERDAGTFTLTFDVNEGDAPELHELAEQIDGLTGSKLSHEAHARVLAELTGARKVITRWVTAGNSVTVEHP